MQNSSQQTSSQNTFKSAAVIQGQADIIRSSIQECILMYPGGDDCINGGSGTCNAAATAGTDPAALENYPINPDSTFYTNATNVTPARAGNRQVKNLRCPGNNGGAGAATHINHEPLFSGTSGKFMPPPPDLFGEWQYYNGVDGVFYWLETDKTDAYISAALEKLDDKFGECEADVIDATAGAVNLDSATTAGVDCPNGNVCFRVWMIANTATQTLQTAEAACQ